MFVLSVNSYFLVIVAMPMSVMVAKVLSENRLYYQKRENSRSYGADDVIPVCETFEHTPADT